MQSMDTGFWSLVLKATDEVIGDCGLTWQRVGYSDHRDLEAGWHTRRDLWNRGLATEAALSVRAYAHETLGRGRLVAVIAPDNLSSQAVARKMGMAFERTDWLDGKERQIFAVELP
jgi:ribosomal-protein-alanine N-acetyltransferase